MHSKLWSDHLSFPKRLSAIISLGLEEKIWLQEGWRLKMYINIYIIYINIHEGVYKYTVEAGYF